jgi:hypothetical protein
MGSNELPQDANYKPVAGGYDPSGHQIVALEAVSVATDATTGTVYGVLSSNASFSASSISINDPTTTSQKAGVNAAGSLQTAGQGVAGTPAGGVMSIQGVAGGTAVPVSGSISATNPSVGTDGSATPASSTLIGASDGTNLQGLLAESASHPNLRVALYNGTTEAGVTANGMAVQQATGSNLHAVLDSGSTTAATQATAANLNATATIQAVTGTSLVADQTNSELRVSLYGKHTTAGDTALNMDASGNAGVNVQNANSNGQATMANSAPVVPASNWFGPVQLADGTTTSQKLAIDSSGRLTLVPNQTFELVDSGGTNKASVDGSGNLSVKVGPALPAGTNLIGYFGRSSVAAYSLASTTTTGSTQNSGDIAVGPYTEISIDINTTAQAGTSPTIQYFYERKGADGIYYVLWQSTVLTAATNTLSTSIGAGMAYNQSLGATGRMRWVIGGSATPTFTHTINVQGK